MRITLRVDTANAAHTRFTVFVNGGNAGALTLRREEFASFEALLSAQPLLEELANDMGAEIDARYGFPDVHPAMEPRYVRDMATVDAARDLLRRIGKIEP